MNTVLFVNAIIGFYENLILGFRVKVLGLRPTCKSLCAVEMTMYVHSTCLKVNGKHVEKDMF